jgi:hypothetical protein
MPDLDLNWRLRSVDERMALGEGEDFLFTAAVAEGLTDLAGCCSRWSKMRAGMVSVAA